MQTFYVDVYFLVNFVIDTLALFFAVRLSRGRECFVRCLIGGVIGAAVATVLVLIDISPLLFALLFFGSLIFSCAIANPEGTSSVFFRILIWFFLLETLIGGAVSFLYSQLDIILKNLNLGENSGAENRTFLYIAAALLIAIGLVRILLLLFSVGRRIRTMRLDAEIMGEKISCECLFDSGNFLTDPLGGYPVVLIKERVVRHALCEDFLRARFDRLPEQLRTSNRMISVEGVGGKHIAPGILVRNARLSTDTDAYVFALVLAIDKEDGDFGGYGALLPGAVLNV